MLIAVVPSPGGGESAEMIATGFQTVCSALCPRMQSDKRGENVVSVFTFHQTGLHRIENAARRASA